MLQQVLPLGSHVLVLLPPGQQGIPHTPHAVIPPQHPQLVPQALQASQAQGPQVPRPPGLYCQRQQQVPCTQA